MKPTISLNSDGGLALELPAPPPFKGSHTVFIPATNDGMRVLIRLLSARESAADKRIATNAAPTQAQVDAWLRADRQAKDRETLKLIQNLEELGL